MTEIENNVNTYLIKEDIEGLIEYTLQVLQNKNISRAKITKNLFELLNAIINQPKTMSIAVKVCERAVEWAKEQNKTFLKQQLEYKLAQFYYEDGQYSKSLQVIGSLLKTGKKADDRLFCVELQLLEAKVHRKVKNLSKARGAMTGAKVDANAIYIQPVLQGELDMCSAFINGEEKDYVTAASYFYEAFENYFSLNMKKETINSLKYLLLMKIMQRKIHEIDSLMINKHVIQYTDDINIIAINSIAQVFEKRNIDEYNQVVVKYQNELMTDEFIQENLNILYNELLQENICRILEPYSSVELYHVAQLMNINVRELERMLRLMILEDKINGIIDQNKGILILYEDINSNRILSSGITLIGELSKVVDSLNEKALRVIQESTVTQTFHK